MSLSWRLIAYAFTKPVWLAGFAAMIAGFVFQFLALDHGALSVVQPTLTTELVFLMLILVIVFRRRVGWSGWSGGLLTCVGLSAFLVAADPGGGKRVPSLESWGEVVASCIAAMALLTMAAAALGMRSDKHSHVLGFWRSALFGTAAAIGFALAASFMKDVTIFLGRDWVSVFSHWELYAMVASGILALFLAQNAFQAGPITASQSALVVVDPLASILIGIGLFGDRLQTSGIRGTAEALGLVVLFLGVTSLSRASAIIEAKRAAA